MTAIAPELVAFLESLADRQALPDLAGGNALLQRLATTFDELRQSEEKYRLVTEHVSVGIIVVQEGRFRYVNPAALLLTGYTAEEMLGQEFAPLIYPDDLPMVADRHLRRLRGEEIEPRYDFRVIRRDGSIAWVQLAAVVIPWDGATATLSFINDITEQKQAELALTRSEERYRSLIDAAPRGMGIVIVRGNRILLSNPAMQAMLGMSADEIARRPSFLEILHPDDREMMARVASEATASATGAENVNTFRVYHAAGRTVWVEGNSVQIEWEGRPATLAYIRDISNQRALERRLEDALGERETMLENSVVGIAFLNPEGRLRWANRPMAQIFGTEIATKVGGSLEPFYFSRDEYLRIGGAVSRAVVAGQTFTEEVRMRRADGSLFWVYLSGRAVNPKDLSRGTVWVVMDITRRKELEDALQRKTSEQEAILKSTQIGIAYTVGGKHVWCNATFAEMLGCAMGQIIGQTTSAFFPDAEAWRSVSATAVPRLAAGLGYSDELEMVRSDGSRFWAQVQAKVVDPANMERGEIWTYVDITRRRQAEDDIRRALEQQRELNDLKSRFVSMTSHEFRTPLATILSSTDLLRHYGDRLDGDERLKLFDSIEAGVKRMTVMLDGILMIGRADAGKLELRPVSMPAGRIVAGMAQEVAKAAGCPERLKVEDATGGRDASLDESLLRHIVGNLVGNGIKYSPDGGSVDLRTWMDGGDFVISVQDRGIGIPPDDVPRLFDSFHRAANVGTISGTGLGLAIVKRAVDRHGGKIEVRSRTAQTGDSGTCFIVRLPLAGRCD